MLQRLAAILFILSAVFFLFFLDSQDSGKKTKKIKISEVFPKLHMGDQSSHIKDSKISKELIVSLSNQPDVYQLMTQIKSTKLSGHSIDKKIVANILTEIEKSFPENENGSLALEADVFSPERVSNNAINPKQLIIQFSVIEIETNNKIAEFSIYLDSKKIIE